MVTKVCSSYFSLCNTKKIRKNRMCKVFSFFLKRKRSITKQWLIDTEKFLFLHHHTFCFFSVLSWCTTFHFFKKLIELYLRRKTESESYFLNVLSSPYKVGFHLFYNVIVYKLFRCSSCNTSVICAK